MRPSRTWGVRPLAETGGAPNEHPVVLARVRAYQAGQDVLSTLTPGEKPRAADDRINTTVRISPEGLEALKNVAAAKRVRVNDLLLDGAEHVLALYGRKMQLRGV
jgi:hypothetical protein